jgi:hypothetical protein
MTDPTPSTYITGRSQPYATAPVASMRRDSVQGLLLGGYGGEEPSPDGTQSVYVVHNLVLAVGGNGMTIVVLDTPDQAEAEAYIANDPDGFLS